MYIRNIFLIFTYLICAQGFDFKLKYCRFRCGNTCETPEDKSNPIGTAKPPADYYWRDFHGVIPPDAYALGPSTQFPRTYIGLVFDPTNNGSFVTTIYDGLDYVYNAFKNETTKIDKHIQIFCTKSPGKLSWIKVTSANIKTVMATHQFIQGAYHTELVDNYAKAFFHFIVSANKCHVTYAGNVYGIDEKLEYALIDGSSDTTNQFLWLMYTKEQAPKNPETGPPCTSKSLFSHHYDYAIRPDSIIPQFYKQINVGSCSITCTNEDRSNVGKFKNDVKLSASMAYYWKPKGVVKKEESFISGKHFGRFPYVGQTYFSIVNAFDVGSSDLQTAFATFGDKYLGVHQYYHVLSSNFPDRLMWVNTTSQDFSKQDKNKMIPGGAHYNGTETFVCRQIGPALALPGSARVLSTGTFCYTMYASVGKFQILMYNQEKE